MNSGKKDLLPYSFSRWTDVPSAKWGWFDDQLDQGWFIGFDPRTAIPSQWSLKPDDTYGLVFWTKNPTSILKSAERLKAFPLVVHMTLTGWQEVEKGAPSITQGLDLLKRTVDTFGPHRVVWRFSPIPLLKDVLGRFSTMATSAVSMGLTEVFVSFLQENDLLPEARSPRIRRELLKQMAGRAPGLQVKLCAEDKLLAGNARWPENLQTDVCESGYRFIPEPGSRASKPESEGCGCALAVDPFTTNESCNLGCQYCYAADRTLATRKRNTTKHALKVVK